MNATLKKFLLVGKVLGESMVPGVAGIEQAIDVLRHPATGAQKQAAVMAITQNALMASESLMDKDLLNDADFVEALRAVNDAYAKLLKVIQRRGVPVA